MRSLALFPARSTEEKMRGSTVDTQSLPRKRKKPDKVQKSRWVCQLLESRLIAVIMFRAYQLVGIIAHTDYGLCNSPPKRNRCNISRDAEDQMSKDHDPKYAQQISLHTSSQVIEETWL